MTTSPIPRALRLPDPFSPGAAGTSVATPTCCCCCCCAVSAVGAVVALPSGLRDEPVAAGKHPRWNLLVLPAALYPLAVVLVPLTGLVSREHLLLYGYPLAALWALLAGLLAGSRAPWRGVVRLTLWTGLLCLEFLFIWALANAMGAL